MEGYLLVDKPKGWTSFDAVKYIRGVISRKYNVPQRKVKVGHSGTLDPFATGLLIMLVGKTYTVRAESLLKQDKTYIAEMVLDSRSDTGDSEGLIESIDYDIAIPTTDEIIKYLASFKGQIEQVPPAYSAIKINGVRAYKLARQNIEVDMQPRKVRINNIELMSYSYPNLTIETDVSSGTYIRSLVEDIGIEMGRRAYTKELRRTKIGTYSIENAIPVKTINEQNIDSFLLANLND